MGGRRGVERNLETIVTPLPFRGQSVVGRSLRSKCDVVFDRLKAVMNTVPPFIHGYHVSMLGATTMGPGSKNIRRKYIHGSVFFLFGTQLGEFHGRLKK